MKRHIMTVLLLALAMSYTPSAEAQFGDFLNKAKETVKKHTESEKLKDAIDITDGVLKDVQKHQGEQQQEQQQAQQDDAQYVEAQPEPAAGEVEQQDIQAIVTQAQANNAAVVQTDAVTISKTLAVYPQVAEVTEVQARKEHIEFYDAYVDAEHVLQRAEAFVAKCEARNTDLSGASYYDCSCQKAVYPKVHRSAMMHQIKFLKGRGCTSSFGAEICGLADSDPAEALRRLDPDDKHIMQAMHGYCEIPGYTVNDEIQKCHEENERDKANEDIDCACYGREFVALQTKQKADDPWQQLSYQKHNGFLNHKLVEKCRAKVDVPEVKLASYPTVKIEDMYQKNAAFYDQHVDAAFVEARADDFAHKNCEVFANGAVGQHVARDCGCVKALYPQVRRKALLPNVRYIVDGTCDKEVVHHSIKPACEALRTDPTAYLNSLDLNDQGASLYLGGYCDVPGGTEHIVVKECLRKNTNKFTDDAKRTAYCECVGDAHTNLQKEFKAKDPSKSFGGSKNIVYFGSRSMTACRHLKQ